MTARHIELVRELAGAVCRCGRAKEEKQTFCRRCYFRLPEAMRKALYRRLNGGYEEAYDAAVRFLGPEARAAETGR